MFLATVDVSAVTDALGGVATAVIAGAGVIAVSALGLGAVYFAGRSLWRFFKSLAK